MQAAPDYVTPPVAPPRRFPFALLLFAAGTMLFFGGAIVLALVAAVPALGAAIPLPGVAIGLIVVLGGVAAILGMSGLVLGWGTASGRPLPRGSHRSVVMSTIAPVAFALLICLPAVGLLTRGPDGSSGTSSEMIVVITTFSIALYGGMLLVVYVQGVRSGLMTAETLGLRPDHLQRGLTWGLAGAGATIVVGALYENVLHALGLPQPQLDALTWLRGMPISAYLAVAFAGAVVAPIVEELFFRGYVFNAYLSERSLATAYIASAVIFSALHGLPTLLPVIFAMGIVLAYVYRRTRSIIAPIVAHMLNNSLAFVSLFASLQTPS
jgi:uncharacterized protein